MRASVHTRRSPAVRAAAVLLCSLAAAAGAPTGTANAFVSVRMESERDEVFVKETFTVTLTVASQGVRLGKGFRLLSLPSADVLRLGPFDELPLERRMKDHQLQEIRRFRCEAVAARPGPLALSPVLRVGILVREDSAFGALFGRRWVESPREFPVERLSLRVLPLPPDGRPPDFSGAVGRFALDTEIRPTDVAVGDLISVISRVRGKGPLEGIAPPAIAAGPHFKAYDARAVEAPDQPGRAFERVLVPLSTNAAAVPAVTFSFFDPHSRSYETATNGPFPLTFHPPRRHEVTPFRAGEDAEQAAKRPEDEPKGLKPLSFRSVEAQAVADEAARAWDIGDFEGAASRYEDLLAAGQDSADLQYNLATARLMAGETGPAVLHLRRAQARGARDPDVAANLRLALARAGLGKSEPVRLPRSLLRRRRWAVLMRTAEAKLAPSHAALYLFDCPEGLTVEWIETAGNWARIASRSRRGWLPVSALAAIE